MLISCYFSLHLPQQKDNDPEVCCVCLGRSTETDNVFVYCDTLDCALCVHQACYGVKKVPSESEPWLCDRCKAPPEEVVVRILVFFFIVNDGFSFKGEWRGDTFTRAGCLDLVIFFKSPLSLSLSLLPVPLVLSSAPFFCIDGKIPSLCQLVTGKKTW